MAKFVGTKGNDRFNLSLTHLKGSTVSGGDGLDTLAITTTGAYTFSTSTFSSLSSIEAFDFSAHQSGLLSVLLSSTMMAQSGTGTLTIVAGNSGIDVLKAGSSVGGTVIVGGTGHVQLDNATNNFVTIADVTTVAVHGGAGSDTIRAGQGGALLDGGAGNDVLVAGVGSDRVVFGSGYRADTVSAFNVATDSVTLVGGNLSYMSEILARMSDTPAGAVLDLGNGDRLTFAGLSVDQVSASNFAGIQAGAPTHVIDISVTAAQLNAMLASAGPGATFILADGVHVFDQAIRITHDDVTFKGQSEDGTIIRFAFAAGTETDGLIIEGKAKTLVGALAADVAADATAVTLTSVAGLRAGDTLYLSQANDTAYMTANGWTNVAAADAAAHPFREAHVQIERIEGNTVYLTHALPFAMSAGVATVHETDLNSGVSLSDFTIDSGRGSANANDFVNALTAYLGLAAVRLDGVIGASLAHISILNPESLGFDIHAGLDVTGDHLTVSGAWNMGSGGNGYGLQIGEMFDSTFNNLVVTDTRHAVLFSGWDSEANNTIHVAFTNRDINFHGGPDQGNVVTVDRGVLSYDPSQDTSGGNGYWAIVGDHVSTHTNIDPYAENTVLFGHAVGSDARDRIFGRDSGAYLNGGNGMDQLVGGAGDDVIVGGLNKDEMTGGAGRDHFLVRVGDNYDIVADFDAGANGDRIVLCGADSPLSFAQLMLTDTVDGVTVRYGANATLTLLNVTAADLSAANFVFDSGSLFGHLF